MEIKLVNGHTVLAAMVNTQFVTDHNTITGIAAVVCEETFLNDDPKRFVVWTAYPDPDLEGWWHCWHGSYRLTWQEAMEKMLSKWNLLGMERNPNQMQKGYF